MQQQATKLNPGQPHSPMANRAWHAKRRETGQTNDIYNPATDDLCTACAIIRWCVVGLIGLIALLTIPSLSATERDHQVPFCEQLQGKVEHILSDRTRVDCLTATHAIEVDFGHKWAEAIGQSLHYALMTDKLPGIYLILEKPADQRYLQRINQVINRWHLPIQVWTVQAYPQ